jgi:hypothetical protein
LLSQDTSAKKQLTVEFEKHPVANPPRSETFAEWSDPSIEAQRF